MQPGFLRKILLYVATVSVLKLRGKDFRSIFRSVRFGGHPHPLVTKGLCEDVLTYSAALFTVLCALAACGMTLVLNLPRLAMGTLGAGAFLAALMQPRKAWRWWLISALAVPLSYVIAENVGISADPSVWQPRQALTLAIAPLVAAYAAAVLRFIVAQIQAIGQPRPAPITLQPVIGPAARAVARPATTAAARARTPLRH